MTNVLWAVPVSDMGGVARHTQDVFTNGVPGTDLHLLVPPGPFADVARRRGFDVTVAPFGPEHGLTTSLRTLRDIRHKMKPNIVHSHLAFADLVASTLSGLAVVSTEHGIAADDRVYHASSTVSRTMELTHRIRMRRTDALLAVSHATARVIRDKWRPQRSLPIDIVPNGIDRASNPVIRPNVGMHFVNLSRLAPEKGLDVLIDAFARVYSDHPEARLTIAGEGPMRAELEAHVARCGLTDVVTMPGFVAGIEQLAPVHVVVQLSVWENCSYALLDAIVAGCGVVATDVGGNGELLPQHCLVPSGSVDAAAKVMITQARHVEKRPQLRDGWPTVDDMCTTLGSVYERVAS